MKKLQGYIVRTKNNKYIDRRRNSHYCLVDNIDKATIFPSEKSIRAYLYNENPRWGSYTFDGQVHGISCTTAKERASAVANRKILNQPVTLIPIIQTTGKEITLTK